MLLRERQNGLGISHEKLLGGNTILLGNFANGCSQPGVRLAATIGRVAQTEECRSRSVKPAAETGNAIVLIAGITPPYTWV
jgi:hypothetical protein